ncbi:hypothetical protein [Pseudomonas corrugata]
MERRLLLFIALASTLLAGNAMAATDLSHADTSVQGLLDLVLQQSHQWSGKLYDYAIRLFWLLATIQFIWTFIEVSEQQAQPQQIDDAPIGPDELSLRNPSVNLFVQQTEHLWHVGQAMRGLPLSTTRIDEQ